MTGGQLNANADQYLQANGLNVPPRSSRRIHSSPAPPRSSSCSGSWDWPPTPAIPPTTARASTGTPNATSRPPRRQPNSPPRTRKLPPRWPVSRARVIRRRWPNSFHRWPRVSPVPWPARSAERCNRWRRSPAGRPGAQQAMQTGMGLVQQAGGSADQLDDASLSDVPIDEYGLGNNRSGHRRRRGGDLGDGGGGTTPTAMLGPPPVPSASTYPSSAPVMPAAPPSTAAPPAAASPGMAGMPMVPPVPCTARRRRQGRQGRHQAGVGSARQERCAGSGPDHHAAAPLPNVTKLVAGKPVATRRIVAPGSPPDEHESGDNAGRT